MIAILGTGIAAFALARIPRTPVRAPLTFFVLSGVLWSIGDVVADGATGMVAKQVGVTVLYTGAIWLPPLWFVVALRWAEDTGAELPLRAPAWRNVPLAAAAITWAVMATNPWHGQFITPVVGGRNVYGPLWYAMAAVSYAEILAAMGVAIAVARSVERPAVRRQAAFLLLSAGVSLAGSLGYVTALTPINPTVLMLSVSISMLLLAMAREGLFGVTSAALSELSNAHPDGVVIIESDDYVAYANDRAARLLAPVPLPRKRPVQEIFRDPRLHLETPIGETDDPNDYWLAMTGTTGLVFRVDAPTPRWLQIVGTCIGKEHDLVRGRLVQISDITARRQAELQARQRRRLDSVTALAGSVSRDFHDAFSLIRTNAELLSAELGDSPAQRHIARIQEATRVGSDLARELEVYAGSTEPVRLRVDLAEILDDVCGVVASNRPPAVRLHYRPPIRPIEVCVDPLQARECVFSLLANAIEATAGEGREIEVVAGIARLEPARLDDLVCGTEQPPGDYAYIEIRDEGGGMTREVEERAFEPFFSTREKNRGSGLSSVLGIVRAHDGAVALYNDPGWGCTFTLYLPLPDTKGEPTASRGES